MCRRRKVTETSADLALLLAIVLSFRNQALDKHLIALAEVSLAWGIRPAPNGRSTSARRPNNR